MCLSSGRSSVTASARGNEAEHDRGEDRGRGPVLVAELMAILLANGEKVTAKRLHKEANKTSLKPKDGFWS